MKIALRIQQYYGRTDTRTHGHTEWLLELLVGAKKDFCSKICMFKDFHVLDCLNFHLMVTFDSLL